MTHIISHSRRLRDTPFTAGVEAAGVKAYTIYNHMLLPTVFEDIEFDYHHLKHHVQVWDVSVERQLELNGPDAIRFDAAANATRSWQDAARSMLLYADHR